MVDRMSELFGYEDIDNLIPKRSESRRQNNPAIKSAANSTNKVGALPKDVSKSDKAKSEGKVEKCKYRNYYDINDTITIAQTTDPHDEDNPNYNRERIFEALERNAEILYVTNDGTDTLYVIISHEGGQNFAKERPIYPGDVKEFYNVYELRLRSPTISLPYRVSEYRLCYKTVFIYGSRDVQLQQDVSRYLITIDTVHSKIHQGVSFHVDDLTLLVDTATPKKYLIITPNTSNRAHMVFVVETEPGTKFEFFEDTTVTANGTALSIINYKRDSLTTSVLQVFKDPTVTVDGTQIFLWQSGTTTAGGKVGGSITHGDEFILKQNAKYQAKITPLSNNTAVFIHFNWYEV